MARPATERAWRSVMMQRLSRGHLLFFCLDGVHRVLLSFPTRRSSDLAFNLVLWSAAATFFAVSRLLRAIWTDRKSTRLNSSHSSISYAVFCLKKKRE